MATKSFKRQDLEVHHRTWPIAVLLPGYGRPRAWAHRALGRRDAQSQVRTSARTRPEARHQYQEGRVGGHPRPCRWHGREAQEGSVRGHLFLRRRVSC